MGQLVAWGIEKYGRDGLSLPEAARAVRRLMPDHGPMMTLVVDDQGRPLTDDAVSESVLEQVRAALSEIPDDEATRSGRPHGDRHRRPATVFPCAAGEQRGHVAFVIRPPGEEFWPMVVRAGGGALAAVFVVAALLGLAVFRLLTNRLADLKACVTGIADGQLSLRIRSPDADELGDLGRSLNRMAERLQTVVSELESTDRKRRQLLADISHELKTPLTVLRGHLEGVLDTTEGSADDRPIAVAFEESDKLALLIDDLLELARMQSPEFRLSLKEAVVQRIVQQAVERFRLAAHNRGIRLETSFHEEPIRLFVDRRRIEQVVVNLLQNALNGIEAGGTIRVLVLLDGDGARIEVIDDGRGIPPGDIERVFDRFQSGSTDGGSTGLGLSIVKQLTEAHGGTVRLECGDPRGVRAIVWLPASAVQ